MAGKMDILAEELLPLLNGIENVSSAANCMTRLRLELKDITVVDVDAIKKLDGVMGVIENGNNLQVVVGPGNSDLIGGIYNKWLETGEKLGATKPAEKNVDAKEAEKSEENDSVAKAGAKKAANATMGFLKHVGNIFIPIVPAFIACGLITALIEVIKIFDPNVTTTSWGILLSVAGGSVFSILNILVGHNSAKEFGGTPALGASLGFILSAEKINGVVLSLGFGTGALDIALQAGRGGVIAVLMLCILAAYFEKWMRSFMPNILSTFLVPVLVILAMSVIGFIIVVPIAGVISDGIGIAVSFIMEKIPWAAGVITGLYLPMVMCGVHQGLIAVNAELIAQNGGWTPLVCVTCMAGAAQVGSSLFVMLRTKNNSLKETCTAALPIGCLGIGEPLLYGVSLRLGRPLLAACLGGAVGGSCMACFGVCSSIPDTTGIQMCLVTNKPLLCLLAIAISIAAGFLFAVILRFNDPAQDEKVEGFSI